MKKYPEYKDSGVEWIGEIPSHWEVYKLFHAFRKIGSGTTPKSDNDDYYRNGTINWVLTGDLNDSYLQETSKKITNKAIEDYSILKTYPEGSLVMAMYGATIGKLSILSMAAAVNQACCVIAQDEVMIIKFLYYWLFGNREHIISLSYGGGQPNISQEIIKELRIQTPPLNEQTAIANFLDLKTQQIDDLIAKKERLIELLKEERTAVINQAVTKGLDPDVPMKDSGIEWLGEIPEHWEVKKVKYLVEINKNKLPDDTDDMYEFQYVDIGNVSLGKINSNPEILRFKDAPSRARRIVHFGDTIVSTVRTYLKAIAFIDESLENQVASTGFAVLSPTEKITKSYLFHLCTSELFVEKVCSISVGISYPATNASDIGNLEVWLPPIKEQIDIADYASQENLRIQNLLDIYQSQIGFLKEYKTSLINDAVTGKIDVRNYHINHATI